MKSNYTEWDNIDSRQEFMFELLKYLKKGKPLNPQRIKGGGRGKGNLWKPWSGAEKVSRPQKSRRERERGKFSNPKFEGRKSFVLGLPPRRRFSGDLNQVPTNSTWQLLINNLKLLSVTCFLRLSLVPVRSKSKIELIEELKPKNPLFMHGTKETVEVQDSFLNSN